MEILTNKQQCTGCAACFNICPTNSIIMKEDKEGFKYPKINDVDYAKRFVQSLIK